MVDNDTKELSITVEFDEAHQFLAGLKRAKQWGLKTEYVILTLRSIKDGESVPDAVAASVRQLNLDWAPSPPNQETE